MTAREAALLTTASPEKRRALAHLGVSDDITAASREAGHRTMAGIATLLERVRADGPLRDAPLGFVTALLSALADATVDYMLRDPRMPTRIAPPRSTRCGE